MALTRLSVRTSLIWRDLARHFQSPEQGEVWNHFVQTLGNLEYTCTSSPEDAKDWGELKAFLRETPLGPLAREAAEADSPFEHLAHWPVEKAMDGLLPGDGIANVAASYYLGQLAYVCGRLRLARELANRALKGHHQLVSSRGRIAGNLAVRILEFLAVTLALEAQFHSRGYDTLRDRQGRLQARRIAGSLRSGQHHQQFGEAADTELLEKIRLVDPESGAERPTAPDDLVLHFIRHFWSPVPTRLDLDNLCLRPAVPVEALDGRALSYELSRRLSAGMLHFRLRHWQLATDVFDEVLSVLEQRKQRGWHPALQQLENEADLYAGRLEARSFRFDKARRRIARARRSLACTRDEFALTKALKYEAEVDYRQHHWRDAEKGFKEVLDVSWERGYDHDYAMAAMSLGRIYSGIGFQGQAALFFAKANRVFRAYDTLQETADVLYWSIATEARRWSLNGHTRESVVTARALMQIYRRLFEGVASMKAAPGSPGYDELAALRQGILHSNHPDIAEVMLDLRLGSLPDRSQVERVRRRVLGEEPRGTEGRESWQARINLCNLLARLIHLQGEGVPSPEERRAAARHPAQLRKFGIRCRLLEAIERAALGPGSNAAEIAECVQRSLVATQRLRLGGGLVPFLVDLSQFFVHRDAYVALLLLLLRALDTTIEWLPGDRAAGTAGLRAPLLKRAYWNLTQYLVLERNFYAGPPAFADRGAEGLLWTRLRGNVHDWALLYERALQGKHGIAYPGNAVALGWVESVAGGSAFLRVLWVEDQRGEELTEDSFVPLKVPAEVVVKGHAAEYWRTPIVLVGLSKKSDQNAQMSEWIAHRLPADVLPEEYFDEVKAPPWVRPRLRAWRRLFRRFIGLEPAAGDTEAVDRETLEASVREKAAILVEEWFGDRADHDLYLKSVFPRPKRAPQKAATAEEEEPLFAAFASRAASGR